MPFLYFRLIASKDAALKCNSPGTRHLPIARTNQVEIFLKRSQHSIFGTVSGCYMCRRRLICSAHTSVVACRNHCYSTIAQLGYWVKGTFQTLRKTAVTRMIYEKIGAYHGTLEQTLGSRLPRVKVKDPIVQATLVFHQTCHHSLRNQLTNGAY